MNANCKHQVIPLNCQENYRTNRWCNCRYVRRMNCAKDHRKNGPAFRISLLIHRVFAHGNVLAIENSVTQFATLNGMPRKNYVNQLPRAWNHLKQNVRLQIYARKPTAASPKMCKFVRKYIPFVVFPHGKVKQCDAVSRSRVGMLNEITFGQGTNDV